MGKGRVEELQQELNAQYQEVEALRDTLDNAVSVCMQVLMLVCVICCRPWHRDWQIFICQSPSPFCIQNNSLVKLSSRWKEEKEEHEQAVSLFLSSIDCSISFHFDHFYLLLSFVCWFLPCRKRRLRKPWRRQSRRRRILKTICSNSSARYRYGTEKRTKDEP